MKKSIALFLAVVLIALAMGTQVFAAERAYRDSGNVEISVQGGKSIELYGHIESTVISVTMPAYIPFDMSRSVAHENKVVSPVITVTNNSYVPVSIMIDRTSVDLSDLPGVSWSNSGSVSDMQIALGLMQAQTHPTYLYGAKWLKNGIQNTQILNLNNQSSDTLYIVGALGSNVPESKTFTVTPTLVVRADNL